MTIKEKIFICIICYSLFSCQKNDQAIDFIEISDLSREHFFVRSCQNRSWLEETVMGPTNSVNYLEMKGNSDSTFSIEWGEYKKDKINLKNLEQSEGYKKQTYSSGSINVIPNASDYYGGDTLWLKYTPLGAKKGKLRFRVVVP